MKRRTISILLCIAFCLALLLKLTPTASADDLPALPEGAKAITSADDLAAFAEDVNAGRVSSGGYYYLTADIDLNGSAENPWTPIGDSDNPFTGTFDGRNHKITGLYVDSSDKYVGLFGEADGTIKNLSVSGSVTAYGQAYTGGIAGYSIGIIENCYNNCTVSGGYYVGGIAGHNGGNNGMLTNCHNTGTVTGKGYVGGVVGDITSYKTITMTDCSNTGTVIGGGYYWGGPGVTVSYTGGIAGTILGTITNCSNTGTVFGVSGYAVGGITATVGVGQKIENCYNDAEVTGGKAGGITGDVSYGTVTNCYNAGDVTGETYAGGIAGKASLWSSDRPTMVEKSYNTGSVTGDTYAGGLVGDVTDSARVRYCYNTGSVTGDTYAGGLAGEVTASAWVYHCYNTGSVTGNTYVGGLSGDSEDSMSGCYYLEGTAAGGINGTGNLYASKTAAQFASGEVAKLLDAEEWGQQLGSDDAPVLLAFVDAPEDYKVLKVSFQYNWSEVAAAYANPGGTVALPSVNVGKTYRTIKWMANGEEFTASTRVNEDMMVTADDSAGELIFAGEGTEANPYKIPDLATLEAFRDYVNDGYGEGEYFLLMDDVDMSPNYNSDNGVSWTPIGNSTRQFTGTFDGGGHTISGLYIDTTNSYQGLFGYVGRYGTVKNVSVSGMVKGGGYAGGVVGYSDWDSMVENCYHTGTVSGTQAVGGVVGVAHGVLNCSNTGPVSGTTDIGGVVGYNEQNSTVENCHNTGTVSGTANVGGVVGGTYSGGSLSCCSNTGPVSGTTDVGGVVGYTMGLDVNNCYNTGSVTCTGNYTGGVAGYTYKSIDVDNCYNTGDVTGGNYVGGLVGYIDQYGHLYNCYNTGTVTGGDMTNNLVARGYQTPVERSYYLDTSSDVSERAKTAEQFASGEVAKLLGGAFGQRLGSDGFPVLLAFVEDAEDYTVLKVTFQYNGAEVAAAYTNPGGTVALPSINIGPSYRTVKWMANGGEFTASTRVYNDTEVIADDSAGELIFAGEGTEANPYKIPDLPMLEAFRDYVNDGNNGGGEYFLVTADIDMSPNYNSSNDESWTPIGASYANHFTGTFDGGGYEITGLYINSTESVQGLFGTVGSGGTVKNVGVSGGSVTGGDSVGGVVGYNEGGTIEKCYNTASISGSSDVGGIVGFNLGTVDNCYNSGSVSGERVGGIVGMKEQAANVTNCYNIGAVSGTGSNVGGIAGEILYGGVINCYNLQTDTINSDIWGGGGENKTEEQFASGEVAWLLQNGQDDTDVQVWGQTVGSGYPELTGETGKTVYRVTFDYDDGVTKEYRYANYGGTVTLPDTPGNMKWRDENNVQFTAGTPVERDMTVTANDAPDAPDVKLELTKDKSSITITAASVEGDYEFSIDRAVWNNGAFTGLDAGTEYTVYVRTKAADGVSASLSMAWKVVTVRDDGSTTLKPGETVRGITNKGGTVTMGGTKTPAVTLPAAENDVEVDGGDNVTVPGGSAVRLPVGIVIAVGGSGATVDSGGGVTLPAGGSAGIGGITVTLPEGGTLKSDDAGDVAVPSGAVVEDEYGTVTIPTEGAVIISGS